MQSKVLVAYATKYGATAEIAEAIGKALRAEGVAVDILPAEKVRDLSPYGAVVLGSAVYVGKWQKEASGFLESNEQALAQRLTWLFSSGPTGEGDPVALMDGWQFPEDLKPIADRIQPREIVVFHGNIDPDKLNFVFKTIINKIGAPKGDFRDWESIDSWARGIAQVLVNEAAVVPI